MSQSNRASPLAALKSSHDSSMSHSMNDGANDGASQIARLKEEVEGLTCALNVLGAEGEASRSEYARRLESKVEIARDELECAIEDQRIFLSSVGGDERAMDDGETSVKTFNTIPTPPLSAPPRLKQDVLSLIAPLPSTHASSCSTDELVSPAERQRRSSFDDAPKPSPSHKYSLEWFKQRMVEEELEKKRMRRAKSRKRGGRQTLYSRKDSATSITSDSSSDNDNDAVEALRLKLDYCPKFSLEWFTLKKELDKADKAKRKQVCTHHNSGSKCASLDAISERSGEVSKDADTASSNLALSSSSAEVDPTVVTNASHTASEKMIGRGSGPSPLDAKGQLQPPKKKKSGPQQRVRPKASMQQGPASSDEELDQLNRKLDTAPPFSLEYFELKKKINSLTR